MPQEKVNVARTPARPPTVPITHCEILLNNTAILLFKIEPQEKIGEGAFGEVYKGLLQDGIWGARIPVAIKTLHSTNMTADDRIKFLQEANIMRGFRHENVIRLHGVCTSKEPIMIVMELCPGGSLSTRLQDLKDQIQRTVAPRSNDCRWLSPETLKSGVYSTKTDVYSFSVMMWEIFSFGQLPFYKYDNRVLRKLIIQKKVCSVVLALPKNKLDLPQGHAVKMFGGDTPRNGRVALTLHGLRSQQETRLYRDRGYYF
ncbi:unnamed protein product [Strongylus vulgaris]|uniref:Protein kinase domain-containing protein n=1 Tax=Strongylus vulgaris TaxID=40348 RepID=A0A3P7J444_STRVU|nr:unnamed protein product [Strongylus vulgaris]